MVFRVSQEQCKKLDLSVAIRGLMNSCNREIDAADSRLNPFP